MARIALLFTLCMSVLGQAFFPIALAQTEKKAEEQAQQTSDNKTPAEAILQANEVDVGESSGSIFTQALRGGPLVFMCLLILISLSVLSWAVVVAKYIYLKRIGDTSDQFVKSFWDSRSLNDLNGRLGEYPYSPSREVFRSGYSELVRASQLKEQSSAPEIALNAAMDNLSRSLHKSKQMEKRKLEKFLSLLAITASVSPFIGLFGTVWGIMRAFEGIARTGSASLAAVAPGISEALIATAFGLAAAIPAVVGYNIFANKIRALMINLDGFASDFLNIVERYLVTDKPRNSQHSPTQSPIGDRI